MQCTTLVYVWIIFWAFAHSQRTPAEWCAATKFGPNKEFDCHCWTRGTKQCPEQCTAYGPGICPTAAPRCNITKRGLDRNGPTCTKTCPGPTTITDPSSCSVHGCTAGWAGTTCQDKCPHLHWGAGCVYKCHCINDQPCDHINGNCPTVQPCQTTPVERCQCDPRWYNPGCQVTCMGDNTWGQATDGSDETRVTADGVVLTTCKWPCHCKLPEMCFAFLGGCYTGGCLDGWAGRRCHLKCERGYYAADVDFLGTRCTGVCRCKLDAACDQDSGRCPDGCTPGYAGVPCEKCRKYTWGGECRQSCDCEGGPCDHVTGECDTPGKCPGYRTTGVKCNKTCPDGEFMYEETKICGGECHCNSSDVCRVTDGKCMEGGCTDGWTGEMCQQKCVGRFGSECNMECHCKGERDCHHVTGSCDPHGCDDRHYGKKCQGKCPRGRYRVNGTCDGKCYCLVDSHCEVLTGVCSDGLCKGGRKGAKCDQQICEKNKWGTTCDRDCNCLIGTCDVVTGVCDSGCAIRYTGTSCSDTCKTGLYYDSNRNCNRKCNCESESQCKVVNGECTSGRCPERRRGPACENVCGADMWGQVCEKICHCMVGSCDVYTGVCDGECDVRHTGPICQDTCPPGYYDWDQECNKRCRCKNQDVCSIITGQCTDNECDSVRRSGDDCQKPCTVGLFLVSGECTGVCRCRVLEECHVTDGSCGAAGCAAGYTGVGCQDECEAGRYGPNCEGRCHCDDDLPCVRTSGQCPGGCQEGRVGFSCQEFTPAVVSAGVWGGIAAALLLLAITALVCWLYQRRKRSDKHYLINFNKDDTKTQDDGYDEQYDEQHDERVDGGGRCNGNGSLRVDINFNEQMSPIYSDDEAPSDRECQHGLNNRYRSSHDSVHSVYGAEATQSTTGSHRRRHRRSSGRYHSSFANDDDGNNNRQSMAGMIQSFHAAQRQQDLQGQHSGVENDGGGTWVASNQKSDGGGTWAESNQKTGRAGTSILHKPTMLQEASFTHVKSLTSMDSDTKRHRRRPKTIREKMNEAREMTKKPMKTKMFVSEVVTTTREPRSRKSSKSTRAQSDRASSGTSGSTVGPTVDVPTRSPAQVHPTKQAGGATAAGPRRTSLKSPDLGPMAGYSQLYDT